VVETAQAVQVKEEPMVEVGTPGRPPAPATVAIVDNDQALCELLQSRLDDEPDLHCAGIATSAEAARTLIARMQPDVVIVDFSLGDGVDAIDLVADLVESSPASQVLIWTKWTDPSATRAEEVRRKVRASRSGASDWIAKAEGIDTLVERVRAATRRGPVLRAAPVPLNPIEASLIDLIEPLPAVARRAPGDAGLTPAERRIATVAAQGLERGMKVGNLADLLKIQIHTLRTHLRNIYAKWGVHTQAEFVAEAHRRGLYRAADPPD
jgi:DNA-binding NarL/FixJ family response regulator